MEGLGVAFDMAQTKSKNALAAARYVGLGGAVQGRHVFAKR